MRLVLMALVITLAFAPSLAMACVYPAPLRDITRTMSAILDAGGEVSNHQRSRLRRAVAQVSPQALADALRPDIARRDHRAAVAILDKAAALANGNGLRVGDDMRDHTARLSTAVQAACSGNAQAVSSDEAAQGAEHGTTRSTGNGGRALTFREGVARLSITFTIYLAFLAFLLGFRRYWHDRYSPPPGEGDDVIGQPDATGRG